MTMPFFTNRTGDRTTCGEAPDTAPAAKGIKKREVVAPLPFGPSTMQSCKELLEEDSGITGVFYPDNPGQRD